MNNIPIVGDAVVWRVIHDKGHKSYSGERSPRTACPHCLEVYNSRRAPQKPKEVPPPVKQEVVEPDPVTVPSKAKTTEEVIKPKQKLKPYRVLVSVPKKEPSAPKAVIDLIGQNGLDKTLRNLFDYHNFDKAAVLRLIEQHTYDIAETAQKLAKVYLGFHIRMCVEIVISVLANVYYNKD